MLQAVEEIAQRVTIARGREQTAGQLLETLGFAADRQWTPVGDLSGGERRRVQLLRLLMAAPNVLMLDEPTNDLDVETLSQVEDLLDGWAGTVIVVSHDRWFLERVCDVMWALPGDGTLRHLPGGVDEYLALRARCRPAAACSPRCAARGSGDSRAARKELGRIERRLEKITTAEGGCTTSWPRTPPTTSGCSGSTPSFARWPPSGRELEDQWLSLADAPSVGRGRIEPRWRRQR